MEKIIEKEKEGEKELYHTEDQLIIFALLILTGAAERVLITTTNQLEWIFDPVREFENNGRKRTVAQAVEDIRLGRMGEYVVTLKDVWAAQNLWLINLRNRHVLTNKP